MTKENPKRVTTALTFDQSTGYPTEVWGDEYKPPRCGTCFRKLPPKDNHRECGSCRTWRSRHNGQQRPMTVQLAQRVVDDEHAAKIDSTWARLTAEKNR